MRTNRERVESLGIGAAQEFLFVGRETFRAVSKLSCDDGDDDALFEDAIYRIQETIRQFQETIETVRSDLPLPEATHRSIRELPWDELTNVGVDEGYIADPNDEIWRCVVVSIVRGDPLAPIEMLIAQLSEMKRCLRSVSDSLESGCTSDLPWQMICRSIRAYLLAVRIGVNASYANAVVGRMRGVNTVPEATG